MTIKGSKLRYFIIFLLLLIMVSGTVSGQGGCSHNTQNCNNPCTGVPGQLWLEIAGGTYIGYSPDPWLNDSSVTSSTNFELNISYHENGATGDVDEIYLIIAVNMKPEGNVSIKINQNELDNWNQVEACNHKITICGYEYPSHGIYNGPDVWYTIYEIEFDGSDKFSPGEHILVDVDITLSDSSKPVKVHFDAVGCSDNACSGSCSGGSCSSCSCDCKAVVFVPPSHDATYHNPSYPIPEFPSILLPIMLLFGAIWIMRNR